MGFFENWKAFRTLAKQQKLSPACQTIFYALLGKFNDAMWAKEIACADRELMEISNVRSSHTIQDAKSRLKLSGLIDFRTSKHYGTVYTLVDLGGSGWGASQTASQTASRYSNNSYLTMPKKEDFKTKDNKIVNIEDRARAREPTAPTATGELSEEVLFAWFDVMGKKADGYEYRKLMMWEREFGTEKLVDSLHKAKDHNKESRISFAFIQAILENRKESTKGGTDKEFVSEYASLEF